VDRPPARAVWVPAGTEHEIHGLGDFAMRTLYVIGATNERLPANAARSTLPAAARAGAGGGRALPIDENDEPAMRLAQVAIDRIAAAQSLPLSLPLPRDPRALRLAERLQADPAAQAELAS
jgi:hypothetical protein